MALLLDTHTFIWFIKDDPSLGMYAKMHLMDGRNERWLSIASLWEMAIKVKTGKLVFPQPFRTFVSEQLAQNKIKVLSIEVDEATGVCDLPYAINSNGKEHSDPFDRIIVTQSKLRNIPLLSNEEIFEQYGVTRIW